MRCDALIPVRLKPLRFFQDCSLVSPQPSADEINYAITRWLHNNLARPHWLLAIRRIAAQVVDKVSS